MVKFYQMWDIGPKVLRYWFLGIRSKVLDLGFGTKSLDPQIQVKGFKTWDFRGKDFRFLISNYRISDFRLIDLRSQTIRL